MRLVSQIGLRAALLAATCGLVAGCATGPGGEVISVYPVATVAWSPDGRFIAAGAVTLGVVYLLDARSQRIEAELTGPDKVLSTELLRGVPLAFSRDGRMLATGGLEAGVSARLWDMDTRREIARFLGSRLVKSLVFSPDGRRVAAAGPGDMVTLWDVESREVVRQWKAHEGGSLAISFAGDGSALASGGADRTLRIWNASTFEQIAAMDGFPGDVTGVAFSPDGSRMAVAAAGTDVRTYEFDPTSLAGAGTSGRSLIQPKAEGPDYSGLMQLLLLFSAARMTQISGVPQPVPVVGAPNLPSRRRCDPAVVFSPDGRRVAAVVDRPTETTQVHIVDLKTGTEVIATNLIGCSIAFSPDGKIIVGGGFRASVRTFDSVTGKRLDSQPAKPE